MRLSFSQIGHRPLQQTWLSRYDVWSQGVWEETMKRREFVTFLGGAAVLRAGIARAQQSDRTRVIGMFQGLAAGDPNGKIRYAAFQQELQQLGWTDGHNVRIERRWGEGKADLMRRDAMELVALSPD